MDIHVISFVLAIVVGVLCFGLVKHTADEFDRWYEQPTAAVASRVSAIFGVATFAVIVLLTVAS
jgi:hypothetical protein